MKRVLLALAGLLVLWFGGRALWHGLASDEKRIRWVIDDMVAGFNETIMNPILDGLAKDYRDQTYGTDRNDLRAAAASLFFSAKDPETKAFPYHLDWRAEHIEVTEGSGDAPSQARLTLELEFRDRSGGKDVLAWRVRVPAQLEEREGDWVFVTTAAETVEGRRIR